ALVNFLFYRQLSPTELDSDFYMARFDSRTTCSDGLLYKPSGHSWSNVPDSTPTSKHSQADIWFQIKVTLKNGYIEIRKLQGRNYRFISKAKIDIDCVAVGIANEVASAEVVIEWLKINGKEYN